MNMLEYSVYSVISPEGCAAILWRDPAKAREAALALRMTAKDLLKLDVIDEIIPEINGGAHVDPERQAVWVGDVLEKQLRELGTLSSEDLLQGRYDRFRKIGRYQMPAS